MDDRSEFEAAATRLPVDIAAIMSLIEEHQHARSLPSELEADRLAAPRLRPDPRAAAFRHSRGPNYGRFRFVRPCKFPFLNRTFVEALWKADSLLVVLDAQTNVNIVLAADMHTNCASQAGLSLGSAIALVELAQPSVVHLKVNVMNTLDVLQFARMGVFLRDAEWIRELRVCVPNMPVRGVHALLDLVAAKITHYQGPSCFLPQLQGRAPLHTLVHTPVFRPCAWPKQPAAAATPTTVEPPTDAIVAAWQSGASKLRFEIPALFEALWQYKPLPLNTSAQSLRITDATMLQKDRLRHPTALPPEVAANCLRSLQLLKASLSPECEVMFNHRGWIGFPAVQSFTSLIAELVGLVQRSRHVARVARAAGVERFVAALEMDVVLRTNDSKRPLVSPALVLRSLERIFGVQFEERRDPATGKPRPDYFVGFLEQRQVVVVLDFSHVLCSK
ncbi:hypothetical protein M3Y99_00515700 [Aphelenchoides fujianensis]|nr:hypothetical protein M3Y99_00515700 [Aphelenchoides fujianensis]